MSQTIIAAPDTAPKYITLPFASVVDVSSTSPAWFLAGFAEWIDSECSDAMFQLRRLSFRTLETDIDAIQAAKRAGISRENSPFADASIPAIEAEWLGEFFFHHLEKARHEVTLQSLAFSHEMALDYVDANHFDEKRQDQFEAQFGAYIDGQHEGYRRKWEASALSVDDLIAFVLTGEKPSPWYGDAAPESGQEWADEFAAWLRDRGVGKCDLRQYIPRFPADEFAAMKATGHKMSSLYLAVGDELRFLCDDPRAFTGWGALSGYWKRFLDCGVRASAYLDWMRQNAKDAPGMDDWIAELEAI